MDNKLKQEDKSVIEVGPQTNYRYGFFEYNKIKYEIGISLYQNAILILITYNGKIGNMYTLDIEEEDNIDAFIEEDEAPEIKTADCILGDRRNEKINFISNLILSDLSKKISKKNSKIQKIIFSLTLSEFVIANKEFSITPEVRGLIVTLKEEINKILNI